MTFKVEIDLGSARSTMDVGLALRKAQFAIFAQDHPLTVGDEGLIADEDGNRVGRWYVEVAR